MLPPCIMLIYSTHTGQPRVISRNLDRPLSCSEVPVRPVIRLFPHFAPPPAVGSGPANRANAAHMHLRVHTSAKQKHEYPSYDPAGPFNGNAKKGHARCPPHMYRPAQTYSRGERKKKVQNARTLGALQRWFPLRLQRKQKACSLPDAPDYGAIRGGCGVVAAVDLIE